MRVLVVDDDRELCRLLKQYLVRQGVTVQCAYNGESGLNSARSGNTIS